MSNPIKSLLPTPLSMEFISDINSLSKLPLPLFRFFIDCAVCVKTSSLNTNDDLFLANILKREKISEQISYGAITAVKLIQRICQKVMKLMRTSEPDQIQNNLQNCQKYLKSVFSQNTLINQIQADYFLQKLSKEVQKILSTTSSTIQTKCGVVEWSIFNLKKANLRISSNQSQTQKNEGNNQQQLDLQKTKQSNLKTINKMYVKVSFDENFSLSAIQKLIGSGFQSNNDGIIQSKISGGQRNFGKSKAFTMSLIDFRLFMEELQKVKNLNY